jgi:hypothetical protein
MDHRSPKTQRPAAVPPTQSGARPANSMIAQVKGRLADDPQWGYFALNGKWICPFCLSPVARRAGKTREDSIVVHLESCRNYHAGRGATQTAEIIARRQQFENLVHLADTDSSWRVYDPTGCWFCPACLERVPTVRVQGQQLNSFVYQAMADHLGRCAAYQRGARPSPDEVQKARDRAARLPALWQYVQSQLQFPAWRYLDSQGLWICPCCLTHVSQVRVAGEADWQRAPEGMVQHLISQCRAYAQDPSQCQPEVAVRQAASEQPQAAPPVLPIARVTTPLPSVRTPLPGGRFTPASGVPIARPASPPGQAERPPGGRSLETTPTRRPRSLNPLSLPGAPATPPAASTTPMTAMPPAPPVANRMAPPRAAAAESPPAEPPKDDTLFGLLKQDFLNDTPLGALTEGEQGGQDEQGPPAATPAPGPDHNAAGGDEQGSLNWMDAMETSSPQADVRVSESTDMIKAVAVQQGLMQKAPEIPGFKCAAAFEPCSDISGDFYQFIRLPDGRIGFALGDVSGHGVQAGLIMSMAKKTFEIYASTGLNPADTLSKVNDALHRDLGGRLFISMVYALLDPTARTLTWARAGHNPSLRFNRKADEVEEIRPPGMVVGMKSGAMFRQSIQEQVTTLQNGDIFVLYTDGITETMNLQNEEFGPERLVDVVKKFIDAGPDALIDRIMEIIRHFRGPRPPADDSTIVILAVD